MINTLDDYICSSMPQSGAFATNPNLRKKVDEEGKLLPFVGNTVVFLLEDESKEDLYRMQEMLYQAAPDMLAQPLQRSTFHMTLHDLANSQPEESGLYDYMKYTQEQAVQILSQWKNDRPLRMKTTWLFNMVNTSIVLGLSPADDETWKQLDDMYMQLESVVPLGYALTPHITMAYFRPGVYTEEQVQRLSGALRKVELEFTLSMEQLVFQNFTDMNHYETVL